MHKKRLIKPQVEAGRENVGKKGVVREPEIHLEVIENVLGFAKEAGFEVKGHIFEHDLQEPSASEAAKLLRKIKKENIFAIFAEPGKKSRMTEMLAREGGIPVIYLNANLKTDSPDELLKIFSEDLEILKKAVK